VTIRLFTYGSLMPGREYAHLLEPAAGTWQPASVRGFIDANGWGHSVGFPAVILDDTGTEIPGMLLTSGVLPSLWASLDEYEGAAYQRSITQATLPDGIKVETFIYTLHPDRQRDT
jgi:gamma-glutamylcyclotransferase (GGCT)/AIG2-like uncharacterized protein YtfP